MIKLRCQGLLRLLHTLKVRALITPFSEVRTRGTSISNCVRSRELKRSPYTGTVSAGYNEGGKSQGSFVMYRYSIQLK